MKLKTIMMVCVAGMTAACSQKQSAVSVPVSHISVEQLKDSIDYDMDITGLPLSDLRVLRNAPAAQKGFPFKDSYLRGIYKSTSWYDSLMWAFDERVEGAQIQSKEGEEWRDFYYRIIDEAHLLNYTEQELAFMKRVKERETELMKQNFQVEEGFRVNMGNLVNPTQLKDFDTLLCQRLAEDGFAIVPANHEQLFHVYEKNDYNEFPNFVTTDLFLQVYHLYIDCMLRELEQYHLLQLMTDFSKEMRDIMAANYDGSPDDSEEGRIAWRNRQFFNVALHLFTGKPMENANNYRTEQEEIDKCVKAENDLSGLLMDYQEVEFPYSLFRARGHYTRSDALKRYFRGMMWLQTASLGTQHDTEVKQAVMMAFAMKDSKSARQKYDKINNLITFLMGKPDNLSLIQVISEVEKTGKSQEELINDKKAIAQLTATLNEIGNKQTRIRPKYESTSHNKICVMPQRYQPDGEVLQEMVDYDSRPTKRATPKGLDVFAAMGVSAAEQILMEEKCEWKDFAVNLKNMKKRMSEVDWKETIVTQWMNTLKVMNDKDKSQKLPYFMMNPEWSKKDLNAALASWAELKHDAILYAKQPMGAECGGGGLPEPVVKGYVEPNINFWEKAIELLDNTAKLLKEQNMLTEKISNATERLRDEASFLLKVSKDELAGKTLTDEVNDQIEIIGSVFENISLDLIREPDQYLMGWSNVEGADRKVALVADVYTANARNNPNKSILFEAVGNADEIYVVVEIGGYLYLTRGAVLSYREFQQSIDEPRLTDEEWQQMLEKNPRKGVPEWMKRIIVPLNKQPEVNEEFFYSSGC